MHKEILLPKPFSFSPKSWEDLCQILLNLKYDVEYQRIPDHNKGDYGLEGYCATHGWAFQAYCPDHGTEEEICSHQRDKITRDLKKLKKYQEHHKTLFKSHKLSSWTLLCPIIYRKELIKHCQKKADEVRNWNLSFIDLDFNVLIKDIKDFMVEYIVFQKKMNTSQRCSIKKVTDKQIEQFKLDAPKWVKDTRRKIKPLYHDLDPKKINEELEYAVKDNLYLYLEMRQILDYFESFDSMIYSNLIDVQNTIKKGIRNNQYNLYENRRNLLNLLRNLFSAQIPDYNLIESQKLADGTISKWLGDCSLEPIYKIKVEKNES